MKKFKLVYCNPVDYTLNDNKFESQYTRYILYKKFLWWYFPLFGKEVINTPYNPFVTMIEWKMSTTDHQLLLKQFDEGKWRPDSFNSGRPVWYYLEKDRDRLNIEYYNTKEEFLDKYSEHYI